MSRFHDSHPFGYHEDIQTNSNSGNHVNSEVESNFEFSLHPQEKEHRIGTGLSRSVRQLASSYHAPGNRLHRKRRARPHKLGALSLYSTEKQEVHTSWMIFNSTCREVSCFFQYAKKTSVLLVLLAAYLRTAPTVKQSGRAPEKLVSKSRFLKEVSLHQKRGPSRYLFCLTMISGTPPRSGLQAKSFRIKTFLFRFTFLRAMSFLQLTRRWALC